MVPPVHAEMNVVDWDGWMLDPEGRNLLGDVGHFERVRPALHHEDVPGLHGLRREFGKLAAKEGPGVHGENRGDSPRSRTLLPALTVAGLFRAHPWQQLVHRPHRVRRFSAGVHIEPRSGRHRRQDAIGSMAVAKRLDRPSHPHSQVGRCGSRSDGLAQLLERLDENGRVGGDQRGPCKDSLGTLGTLAQHQRRGRVPSGLLLEAARVGHRGDRVLEHPLALAVVERVHTVEVVVRATSRPGGRGRRWVGVHRDDDGSVGTRRSIRNGIVVCRHVLAVLATVHGNKQHPGLGGQARRQRFWLLNVGLGQPGCINPSVTSDKHPRRAYPLSDQVLAAQVGRGGVHRRHHPKGPPVEFFRERRPHVERAEPGLDVHCRGSPEERHQPRGKRRLSVALHHPHITGARRNRRVDPAHERPRQVRQALPGNKGASDVRVDLDVPELGERRY
mmetsp:Transcript_13457/g.34511  ORF Transcript_13457/g.34511 Transcript_13457/m.34511 type:complete len:446 (+) Transcript_13457:960-2297(+)